MTILLGIPLKSDKKNINSFNEMEWNTNIILFLKKKLQIKGKGIVINFFYLLSSMKFPNTLGKKIILIISFHSFMNSQT